MPLPDRVKVGAAWWRVVGRTSLPGFFGRAQVNRTRILVWTKASADQQRDTLLHEVLHAILSNVPHGMDDDSEEALVLSLAPWLLQVLRDNPQLVGFLLGGE